MRRLLLFILMGFAIAAAVEIGAGGALPRLQEAGSLRFCVDPDNLPFASQDPQHPGFEVELGRAIAQELGLKADFVWMPTQRGGVVLRQLLEGRCDLVMGLPQDERFLDDNPRVGLSRPYYSMGHVFVLSQSAGVREPKDLGGKPVAVEFSSLGDLFAFKQGYSRQTYLKQAEVFWAMAKGEAAAAVMWAPIAGWMLKMNPDPKLQLTGIQAPDLQFDMAVGMRKTDADLKAAVDGVLLQLGQRNIVTDILKRYGVPISSQAAGSQRAKAESSVGENLYRMSCVECHGSDARGGGLAANLTAYKDTDDAFVRVVLNGRPATPMQPFKGLLTEEEVRQILAYIRGLPH
jgi:polar amino acid transport system substrate-binding protein